MHKLSPMIAITAGLFLAAAASAQSSCSSDGQRRPVALLERFISADCETCWRSADTPRARPREMVLDWIVPSARGEDALLSPAASPDSRDRLEALGRPGPAPQTSVRTPVARDGHTLRVARGLPISDYVGASIELRPGTGGPWRAWLALAENVPAGTGGSPVARNVVRAVFQPPWDGNRPLSKKEQQNLWELRPLKIPEGAKPERLRVLGWVEDARGRIVAAAESRCAGKSGRR